MPPTLLCQSSMCGHTADLHGQRAGVLPGYCLHRDCHCPNWNPPTSPSRATRLADPHHDRDLYIAWIQALDVITHGADPDAGYQLMMTAIARWQRRVLGLSLTPRPASQTVEKI